MLHRYFGLCLMGVFLAGVAMESWAQTQTQAQSSAVTVSPPAVTVKSVTCAPDMNNTYQQPTSYPNNTNTTICNPGYFMIGYIEDWSNEPRYAVCALIKCTWQ